MTTLKSGKRVSSHIFILILSIGAWLRLSEITSSGIVFTDAFGYIQIAAQWDSGTYTVIDILNRPFFRPALFLIQALALRAFSYEDYAVKAVNAGFDITSIILVALIVLKLYRSPAAALSAAALYAFSRTAILFSRNELAHCPSTFFLLLSFLFLISGLRQPAGLKSWIMFCLPSGIFLSVSALTHGDIVLVAPAFIASSFIHALNDHGTSRSSAFVPVIIFTLGLAFPVLIFVTMTGTDMALNAAVVEIGRKAPRLAETSMPFGIRLLNGVIRNLYSGSALWFFWAALIEHLFRAIRQPRLSLLPTLPLFSIFTYITLFHFFVERGDPHWNLFRILFPFFPFVFISIAVSVQRVSTSLPRPCSWIFMTCITLWLSISNLPGLDAGLLDRLRTFDGSGLPSPHRRVYDVLRKKTSDNSRLLIIAPYSDDIRRNRGYQSPVYFRSHAVYLADCPSGKTLEEFFTENKIRYILVDSGQGSASLTPLSPIQLPGCFLPRAEESSSFHDKMEAVYHFLSAHRAEVSAEVPPVGTIFHLEED